MELDWQFLSIAMLYILVHSVYHVWAITKCFFVEEISLYSWQCFRENTFFRFIDRKERRVFVQAQKVHIREYGATPLKAWSYRKQCYKTRCSSRHPRSDFPLDCVEQMSDVGLCIIEDNRVVWLLNPPSHKQDHPRDVFSCRRGRKMNGYLPLVHEVVPGQLWCKSISLPRYIAPYVIWSARRGNLWGCDP